MRQIVLDTETTGLNPKLGNRVIEIGCVELHNRMLTGNNFHVYINPERDSEEGALNVHGLTTEFLSDKPKFHEIVEDLRSYIAGAEVIIHNAPFDLGFLNHEFARLKLPSFSDHVGGVIDTLVQAKELHQRVDDAADMVAEARQLQARELMVQKTQIEGRVMNNDFGAGDVAAQVFDDLVELRLIAEKLGGQAVDIERALFRIALGIDVDMEVIPRQHAVVQFDATDFDDAVAQLGIEAGGFSI